VQDVLLSRRLRLWRCGGQATHFVMTIVEGDLKGVRK